MNINILTIFPEIFDALNFGVVSKSLDKDLLKVKTFDIKILSDDNFVIPEFKIDLLNKSKKLINSVENISKVIKINKLKTNVSKLKKEKDKGSSKIKDKSKKTKSKKKIRTLWIRRKKKN